MLVALNVFLVVPNVQVTTFNGQFIVWLTQSVLLLIVCCGPIRDLFGWQPSRGRSGTFNTVRQHLISSHTSLVGAASTAVLTSYLCVIHACDWLLVPSGIFGAHKPCFGIHVERDEHCIVRAFAFDNWC